MPLICNTEFAALLNAATSKAAWGAAFEAGLGATRRVVCKKDGTTFRDCALTGAMTYAAGTFTHIGYVSGTTTATAADLSSGTCTLHIEGNGNWVQGTLGLSASGRDFIISANPTTTNGLGFVSVAITAPAALPNGSYTLTAAAGSVAMTGRDASLASSGGVLATMTLANTSGLTVSSDFIPPMFGHPFRKGDVPTGRYPKFELAGGTNVPYTMFNTRLWSDGSLKFASFLIRVPTTIAASGTLSLLVKTTASAPAASSSRALSDLSSSSTDLKVELTGFENLSGTWTSSLNQGVTDNDDVITFGDGAAGKVWRIRQQFMQSGSNHGQLECYWYVAALQNAAGSLYGLRYLGRVCQPWYDVDTPAKTHRIFSGFTLKNGASTVRDIVAAGGFNTATPFSFTDTGSVDVNVTATAHGHFTGAIARVAGTSLPSPLAAGTNYLLYRVDANTLRFCPDFEYGYGGSSPELTGTATSATFTVYPWLAQFSSLWTCGTDAKWDYAQAGGSVGADVPVRVQHDSVYWRKTWTVAPYTTLTPDAQTAVPYRVNYMGPMTPYTDTTGERDDIGLLPSWHVRHLLSQNATDEQISRVVGLAAAHAPFQLYNSTTKTLPTVNAGTYSGMPTANENFQWRVSGATGFTAPTGIVRSGFSHMNYAHMPSMAYYPYLFSGEPQYLDVLLEVGQYAVSHRYAGTATSTATGFKALRNGTINGTFYTGMAIGDDGTLREDAWSIRELGYAAGIVPDSAPQCAAYKTQLNDMYSATYTALNDWTQNQAPTFYRTAGLMHFRENGGAAIGSPWMHNYFTTTTALTGKLTENANAMAMLTHALTYYDFVRTNYGSWHIGSYRNILRTADAGNSPYVTSAEQIAFYELGTSNWLGYITWTTGTNAFAFTNTTAATYFANGDRIIFDLNDGHPAPSGLSTFTTYYIIGKSGVNFQLSATSGGSAVAVSGSGSGGCMVTASNPPSTGSIEGTVTPSNSMTGAMGAVNIGKAAGGTVTQTTVDEIEARVAAVNFAPDPKNRINSST